MSFLFSGIISVFIPTAFEFIPKLLFYPRFFGLQLALEPKDPFVTTVTS